MREYREARFRFFRHTPEGLVVPTDDPVAKSYIPQARTLLGEVKQQIALGLINQGLRRVTLDNGVRLEAYALPGQDEMRISVPISFGDENAPRPEPRPEEQLPFMWIGARVMWERLAGMPNVPYEALILMVVEPGENGVLTAYQTDWPFLYFTGYQTNDNGLPIRYPRSPMPAYWTNEREFSIAGQDAYLSQRPLITSYNAYLPEIPEARRPYIIDDVDSEFYWGRAVFTRHNLIHHDHWGMDGYEPYWIEQGFPPSQVITRGPHDPMSDDTRTFPDDYQAAYKGFLWDQVVVLDPDPGKGRASSRRAVDRTLLRYIASQTGTNPRGMTIDGEYSVKIGMMGTDCPTGTAAFPYSALGFNDEEEYLDATPVEIEVRLGRDAQVIQRAEISIPRYSEIGNYLFPFGMITNDVPSVDAPNPHALNWWQGSILANPKTRDVRVEPDLYVPNVFGEVDTIDDCSRMPWDLYVRVFLPFASYASSNYAAEIASQVYSLIDSLRQGVVGRVNLPRITEAEILAVAPNAPGLYRYDVDANSFSTITTYPEWFSDSGEEWWNEPFRYPSLRACRGFARCQLGQGSPLYSGYQPGVDPADIGELPCWN